MKKINSLWTVLVLVLSIIIHAQETPSAIAKTLNQSPAQIEMISLLPLGKILAVATSENKIKIYSLETGKEQAVLFGHSQKINCIAFNPDGTLLASAGNDNIIILWEIAGGNPIKKLSAHSQPITCLAFSPDGKLLASGSKDKTIILWNVQNGQILTTFTEHKDEIISIAFNVGLGLLVSAGRDSDVKLWPIGKYEALHISAEPKDAPSFHARANFRRMKGDLEGAIADYLQAIQLNPKYAEAYYNLACMYSLHSITYGTDEKSKEQDFSESLKYLDRAIREGYRNWQQIEKDSALSALRADARYRQLMDARMQEAYKTKEETLVTSKDIQEKSRNISFNVLQRDGKLEARAHEIILNGKKIKPEDKFFPAYEYDIVVLFKEFETVKERLQIDSGTGPVILRLPLKRLKKCEFRTRENLVALDGIDYTPTCFVDGKEIEPHLVDVNKSGVFFYYDIWVDPEAQNLRMNAGYRYAESPISLLKGGILRLEGMSIPLLIEHLGNLAKKSSYGYKASVLAMENLLKNRATSSKIKYSPMNEISQLVNYIEGWEFTEPQDRSRVKLLIDAMESLVGYQRTKED